jgi:hypothetical protein
MATKPPPKPGDKKKKKKNPLDALWGPLGLLLIFVVMAVSAAAITMLYDSLMEVNESR